VPEERWAQIKSLFESAISQDVSERDSFLAFKCGSDDELRREVQSLLSAYESTGDFLEDPYFELKSFAKDLENSGISQAIGSRIGAYRIEQQIGHGGMGAVYLATRADDEFRKQVAIKLIRVGNADELAIRRFRNERQILASLEHPYVARLIDGGTTPDGLPYFVMEYVEGRSLVQYCLLHNLSEKDRLGLMLKICSAVLYAHCRSIIHRDLKPSNILVREDGTPKLLDFGIAKLLATADQERGPEVTLTGMRALTPAYASPEQLQGLPATVSSDVYSLGVIFFEMLTGERFSAAALRQNKDSDRPNAASPVLASDLRALINKATQWDPADRYENVESFSADIQSYLDNTPLLANSQRDNAPAPPLPASIAILPFEMTEPETTKHGYLGIGVTDALITRLSSVGRISVRPTSAVSKYARGTDVIQAGKELHVRYVLEGRIRNVNNHVRASVQLVSVESGNPVWAGMVDASAEDLLTLEDSIAEQVARALIPQLTAEEHELLRKRGTANAKAHELYLKGRWHRTRAESPEELAQSLVCFMGAIAEDAEYARAHAGVADYYVSLGMWGGLPPAESFAAAKSEAAMALELDPMLPEAHSAYGFAIWAFDGAVDEAEQHAHIAITRDPEFPDAHFLLGLLSSARNRPELAVVHLERACKLLTDSPYAVVGLANCYYNSHQFQEALNVMNVCSKHPTLSAPVLEYTARSYVHVGEAQKAVESATAAVELSGRSPSSLQVLAQAEAANGNRDRAQALVDELETLAKRQYVSGYLRALGHLVLDQKERAIELLEQAVGERDWRACWLAVCPDLDPLRGHPRFNALLSKTPGSKSPGYHPVPAPLAGMPRAEARKRLPVAIAAPAIAALIIIAAGLAWHFALNRQPPFQNIHVTKLTSNGTATAAAISPDGADFAYISRENRGYMVRMRRHGEDHSTRLTKSTSDRLIQPSFTQDGRFLTFVSYPASQPSMRSIHLLPLAGGAEQIVPQTFTGPVSLSGDGKRAAYLATNDAQERSELWTERINGSERRLLASLEYPSRFTHATVPAWSNDGRFIACGVEAHDSQGFLIRIVTVDTSTGEMRDVPSPRWQSTQHFAWANGDSGLAVIGQEHDSAFQQIWYIPYPHGEARRVTNDLNDYSTISLDRNSTSLVSVQVQTLSNIYLQQGEEQSANPTQVTIGSGRYFDLSWAPDGHILYASDATGSADLWVMSADGSEQRKLTSGQGRSYAPAASSDGKWIAFHSNMSGNWNIWRAKRDGTNPVQLTTNVQDSNWPQFTTDSSAVVFHHTGANGMWNIWKVPVSGGAAVQLTRSLTTHPTLSPKDGNIACWYSTSVEKPNWQLAIFPPEGGEPIRTYRLAPTVVPDSNIRWSPSGSGITFLDVRAGASNIWLQPVDGSPARPLTSFTSGQIYSFDWSRDGRLIYSRGMSVNDVVLIRQRPE
jgi:serine/threonine protein kinase/Tol biopolymer transport system component/Tfp pilus assembly protein PilF